MPQRLPRFAAQLERIEDLRKIGRILLEAQGEDGRPQPGNGGGPQVAGSTPAADQRRLRGLPAVARGVSGAIPGTRPEQALLAAERRRTRRSG